MAPVTADDQIGADRKHAVRRVRAQSNDPPAILDKLCRLGLHVQTEGPVALAVLGQEIEKIPLRHHRYVFAASRQMAEIDHLQVLVADLASECLDLLVRQLEEFIEQ